jgi:hypothetical protein
MQEKIVEKISREDGYLFQVFTPRDNMDVYKEWEIQEIPAFVIPLKDDASQHLIAKGIKGYDTLKGMLPDFLRQEVAK